MNIRAAKAALTVWEVPSFERPRMFGRSNLNAIRDGLRILRVIWHESPGRALRSGRLVLAAAVPEVVPPAVRQIGGQRRRSWRPVARWPRSRWPRSCWR